jgi:hypothetical protein
MEIKVEFEKFKEMSNYISCSTMDSSGILKTFIFNGIEYCVTSAIWRGQDFMKHTLFGYVVIDKEVYVDALESLPPREHWDKIALKGRDRSYKGILVPYGKKRMVVLCRDEVSFIPMPKVEQLTLF